MEGQDQSPPKKYVNNITRNTNSVTKLPKNKCFFVASLNVRTLLQDSRITELTYAIKSINWDIIGLCETRRGKETTAEYDEFILYHSTSTNGRNGVGFLIKKYLKNQIISLTTYSNRIAALEIELEENTIWTLLQVYLPTEKCKNEDLDDFYSDLEKAMESVNTKNLIMMGDFNAQVGERQVGEEKVLGPYSYGKRSKHGQILIEFALEKQLKIINGIYQKKQSKKWTWRSPNGKYHNEIDYILTNKVDHVINFDIINTLNFETDHQMIRCKLFIKKKKSRGFIKNNKNRITRELPELTEKLAKDWEEKLIGAVTTSNEIETQYKMFEYEINELLKHIQKEIVENKRTINDEIQQKLKTRKLLYKMKRTKQVKAEITKISKQINRSISKATQQRRLKVLEKHIMKTGGIKRAYKELNINREWTSNLKSKTGKVVSKRPEIINEATEFYKNLYADETAESYIFHTSTDPICKILKSEIRYAIQSQKNNKAPGEDNITNEFLKSTLKAVLSPLQILLNNIIETGVTPNQWSKSVIMLLHKKGDKNDLGNYRPISIMSNIYKVFSKILLNRLSRSFDENQPCEQAGFRKNFSTIDHIQVVTQIIEKSNEYNKTLYLCFIDFTKAFDSLNHYAIWEALQQQNIESRYISLLHSIYSKIKSRIKLEREGAEFDIKKGVRQGDPISPKIFSSVLELVFRNLNWHEKGLRIDGKYISHLRFADDIIIFAENLNEIKTMMQELARESEKVGLLMNLSKTKAMTNGTEKSLTIDGENIEFVRDYIYLGQLISFENRTENDINRRIAIAWKKFWNLKEIMKNKEINIEIKRKLYETVILPCLTYGCQCWSLRKSDECKLAICQRKMERSMLGIKQKDKINNHIIRKITKLTDIIKRIRILKWSWAGHICRMENTRWTKIITEWLPRDGKRSRGKQKKRWADIFVEKYGPTWMKKGRDRELWKAQGEAYARKATTT